MKFTESHEWIELNDAQNLATVGVSHYAQKELGYIVYVELPQIGKHVDAGEEVAVLESTKAAADVYSPVSGNVVEVNTALNNNPELINQSPQNQGWIFKLKPTQLKEMDVLLSTNDYQSKFG